MSNFKKSYSRKQAGVVYRAIKEGKLEANKNFISDMYDYAQDEDFGCPCYDGNNCISNFIDLVKAAIDYIFAGDYENAQLVINEAMA